MRRTFLRTPQACDPWYGVPLSLWPLASLTSRSRRRKTKCDGVRPCCNRCAGKRQPCLWSVPEGAASSQTPATAALTVLTPESAVSLEAQTPSLKQSGLDVCLEHFFTRHFSSDFCAFDQRADFEDKCRREPLLSAAVVALCSRYLSSHDAQAFFDLPTGWETCRVYMQKARALAKASSDQPSVTHIQGNLIIAHAELLSNSGSRHWLFCGSAIRMAEIMRLNKSFHQNHSIKEQEVRRRTFWACLLLDRALAYFLTKHRTIDLANVTIPVPSTDVALVYQEETQGVTLGDLVTHRRPSELGLSPYLIKTVCLWSDVTDLAAYSRRNLDQFPPTDPRSLFFTRHNALKTWADSLHPSLKWNMTNFRNHVSLGQSQSFVAMHSILRSAGCVGRQCYLPHLAMYTKVVDWVDGAGWSYLHREQSIVSECVSSALAYGEILESLTDSSQSHGRTSLQSVWVAASVLIIANTFLWLRYAGDEAYSDAETQQKASAYWDASYELIGSWCSTWKAAKQWLVALDVMHNLYRAAYLGELDEDTLRRNPARPTCSDDDDSRSDFRPQPGDGYPSLISMPSLQASVKFATGDTSAKSIDIAAIWQQLSSGWPYDFIEFDTLMGSVEPQVDYASTDRSPDESQT